MTLRKFVKAVKVVTDAGLWSDKRMPRIGSTFPLSKARSLRVGTGGWRWRVLQVSDTSHQSFRLLLLYQARKQDYCAILARPVGRDMLVLGRLEYHASHPGWHVHATCRSPLTCHSGRLRHDDMKRLAGSSGPNARMPFPLTDDDALEIARRFFRLPLDLGALPPRTTLSYLKLEHSNEQTYAL